MPATYEWDIETWKDDEVVDHDHRDRLHEFGGEELTMAVAEDGYRLVLVRDAEDGGRSWAYVSSGEMPEFFTDAYGKRTAKVPNKYRAEFNL